MVLFVKLMSTTGLVVVAVVLVIMLAPVPLVPMVDTVVSSLVAATVLAKFCSSWIVVQAVISLPESVVIVADVMARVWSTITGNAQGTIPTKQAIDRVGCNRVPPNLAQLCVQRILFFGPASRTATSISLVSAMILWSRAQEHV